MLDEMHSEKTILQEEANRLSTSLDYSKISIFTLFLKPSFFDLGITTFAHFPIFAHSWLASEPYFRFDLRAGNRDGTGPKVNSHVKI